MLNAVSLASLPVVAVVSMRADLMLAPVSLIETEFILLELDPLLTVNPIARSMVASVTSKLSRFAVTAVPPAPDVAPWTLKPRALPAPVVLLRFEVT